MLPMVNEDSNPRIFGSLFLNKTWLSTLGLSVPKTVAELKKVLQAFKESDPNGNGKKDEIPLLLKATSMAGCLPGCLYGPFGLSVYGGNVGTQITNDGQIQLNYISDNYKRALIYYRNLYQAGLINSDWFDCSDDNYKAYLNSQTPVVGAFAADNATSLIGAERMKNYVTVPALSDGQNTPTWAITDVEYVWPSWFLVTSACKYPEIAVRFADYFYSNEGSMTAAYGPQGYNWDADKNGNISMTENYYKSAYKTSDLTPGYPIPAYYSKAMLAATEISAGSSATAEQKAYAQEKKDKIAAYSSVAPKYPRINDYIWEADRKQYGEVEDYLSTYLLQLNHQFLDNECNIETFWDNYVGVCNSLGAQTQKELLQKSLNRYFDAVGR